jgi:hypothetical protein
MQMINRAVVIVRPKQPLLDWVNATDPPEEPFTLDQIRGEGTALLVPEVDDERALERVLRRKFPRIFEQELEGWCNDEDTWPVDRSYKVFREWFDVEFHSMVFDLADDRIAPEKS